MKIIGAETFGDSVLAQLTASVGVTPLAHGEDGLLTTSVEGESLLAITYTTRCRKWRGSV